MTALRACLCLLVAFAVRASPMISENPHCVLRERDTSRDHSFQLLRCIIRADSFAGGKIGFDQPDLTFMKIVQ